MIPNHYKKIVNEERKGNPSSEEILLHKYESMKFSTNKHLEMFNSKTLNTKNTFPSYLCPHFRIN